MTIWYGPGCVCCSTAGRNIGCIIASPFSFRPPNSLGCHRPRRRPASVLQIDGPDLNDVGVAQWMRPGDRDLADERPVRASEILDFGHVIGDQHARVTPRHAWLIQPHTT